MVVDFKRFVKHAPLEPESGTPRPLAPRRARTPALRRARTPPPSPACPCAPPRPARRAAPPPPHLASAPPGVLTVAEQLPGLISSADQTAHLATAKYFASYNQARPPPDQTLIYYESIFLPRRALRSIGEGTAPKKIEEV